MNLYEPRQNQIVGSMVNQDDPLPYRSCLQLHGSKVLLDRISKLNDMVNELFPLFWTRRSRLQWVYKEAGRSERQNNSGIHCFAVSVVLTCLSRIAISNQPSRLYHCDASETDWTNIPSYQPKPRFWPSRPISVTMAESPTCKARYRIKPFIWGSILQPTSFCWLSRSTVRLHHPHRWIAALREWTESDMPARPQWSPDSHNTEYYDQIDLLVNGQVYFFHLVKTSLII
jgi:hypothetical protein